MKRTFLIIGVLLTGMAPLWAQEGASGSWASSGRQGSPGQPAASAQPAYFIDGYHGGIYGHIPSWQARFMVDKLNQYPGWKINLELEPESWDTIEKKYPGDYADFARMIADQTSSGRIEYINPAYAQSYMYDISGESIIRQFYYGMRKLRAHFPGIVFTTYSSEEPCFTSALPQILLSYGIRYASLKNPNTCWGGYARAYGGELVNWIGPDGSRIVTVPRYAVEALKPKSTWETIASNNSVAYVTRALDAGIKDPVGMCLQDAGWAYGPWIKQGKDYVPGTPGAATDVKTPYMPTVFETWRGYIENRSVRITNNNWRFSQEDVLVSLVWGGQVLQRIAREVRASENKIVATEKLAALAAVFENEPWPGPSLDEAWRTLLLSQHHDCWIVPYNENNLKTGGTWADNVVTWTGNTNARCDTILEQSMSALAGPVASGRSARIKVFNTTAGERNECAAFTLPEGWAGAAVLDSRRHIVVSQPAAPDSNSREWLFRADVPAMGYATYYLEEAAASQSAAMPQSQATPQSQAPQPPAAPQSGARAFFQKDGTCKIETDLYRITLDPARGGVIRSLVAVRLGNREFAGDGGPRSFGELRGNFYALGGFHSSTEAPAQVRILENGPIRVRVEVRGLIAGYSFIQVLTLVQGQRRIDARLKIDWTTNTGIGESPDSMKGYPLRKAFYNDSFKLQALFPLRLASQRVYKNAPFDVLESRLPNTFFDSWDSIKNVVLLNWVDVTDGTDKYGMAVLSDHTTSYAHGPHYPLGLTIQYSGDGLFYRNYTLRGPSEVNYALIPHAGKWDKAGIWTEGTYWNEPLRTWVTAAPAGSAASLEGSTSSPAGSAASPAGSAAAPGNTEAAPSLSMIRIDAPGWEVSSVVGSGKDLLARLFNAEGDGDAHRIYLGFAADSVRLVALDGRTVRPLALQKDAEGRSYVVLSMPRFGFRTLQFVNVSNPSKK